jgi:hypothetical protein
MLGDREKNVLEKEGGEAVGRQLDFFRGDLLLVVVVRLLVVVVPAMIRVR